MINRSEGRGKGVGRKVETEPNSKTCREPKPEHRQAQRSITSNVLL